MDTGPAAHLPFGGSTAHRWMRCAGSVSLCATLPPQPESEHMARGTRAHALLEHALGEELDSVLDWANGHPVNIVTTPYDQEDVEAVQVALDYVNGILDASPDAQLFIEQRVNLHDDVGGTADVLIYVPSKRHLHVIDYKHGAGHYVTEHAPQFKFYATCAVLTRSDLDVGTIYATVIQPRCWQGADQPVRTAVYSPADLIMYSDDVDAAVELAKVPNPPFVAGEWCDWCQAAHVCPAHRDAAFQIVTLPEGGSPLPHGDEIVIKLPAPGECRDPAVLALTLPALGQMKAWIAAMEDIAYAEAMSGKHLPGYKLVPKRGTRQWIAGQEGLAEHVLEDAGISPVYYAPRRTVSVAQAEKLLKGNKPAIQAMAAFVEKKSSGLKLVAETEPGEPVNPLELLAASALPPPIIE